MSNQEETGLARAIELMQQVLQVEYTFIVHYPRLMDAAPDAETRELIRVLGESSVRHADTTAQALRGMGVAPPFPGLELLPDLSARELFQKQLEYEKLALMLHSEGANLVTEEWREPLRRIADEERWHIQVTETILERLANS